MLASAITLTITTMKLNDYSHADYIPIIDGDLTIWDRYGYLGHTSNITSYETYVEDTRRQLNYFGKDHMRNLITTDLGHIESLIATIRVHHRHARSINLLGTALKVIAGTPDFDDWEQIKFKQGQLIDSANRQIEINTKLQSRLNEITRSMNAISKTDNADSEHLFESILAKNRIIITNLEDLILSVTLAKINLISPLILDSVDIHELANELLTNTSLADILRVSSVKAFQNNDLLYFLIKYPKPETVCKKINVFPVQHNKIILDFENNNVVAECGARIYAVKECNAAMSTTFCKRLQNPTCAQQLVSGTVAQCTTLLGHLDPVTLVEEGVLIINDATFRVEDSLGSSKMISGTYLATYDDRISLNGTHYENHQGVLKKKPAAAVASQINVTSHRDQLSLPFLHELSLQNLQHIGSLKSDIISRPILSSGITIAVALIVYGIIQSIRYCRVKRRHPDSSIEMTIPSRKAEDDFNLTRGGVNTRRAKIANSTIRPDAAAVTSARLQLSREI